MIFSPLNSSAFCQKIQPAKDVFFIIDAARISPTANRRRAGLAVPDDGGGR